MLFLDSVIFRASCSWFVFLLLPPSLPFSIMFPFHEPWEPGLLHIHYSFQFSIIMGLLNTWTSGCLILVPPPGSFLLFFCLVWLQCDDLSFCFVILLYLFCLKKLKKIVSLVLYILSLLSLFFPLYVLCT